MKNRIFLFLFAFGIFFGSSCTKIEPHPKDDETADQTALVKFISEKHTAEMALLHQELAALKQIAEQKTESNIRYVALTKNVTADSSEFYQKKLMQNLLVFHRIQDPALFTFDTTGTLLQQGNRRLVSYLFERENVALRDNIIKVQDRIILSLKEQRTADSTYNGMLAYQIAHAQKQNQDLSWQLSNLNIELDATTRKRNHWRAACVTGAGLVAASFIVLK